VSIYTDLR